MTPPTSEVFHGDPVPIPVERFSQRGESRAAGIVRRVLSGAARKAAEVGDDELAEAFSQKLTAGSSPAAAATVPAGVIPERHRLNEEVNAFMAANPDADIDTAIRHVTGEGSPQGVDLERAELNQRVERFMARTGCDISEAIREVMAQAPPGAGAGPGEKPSGASEADLKRERKLLNAYLERNPSATLAEATAAVAKTMKGAS